MVSPIISLGISAVIAFIIFLVFRPGRGLYWRAQVTRQRTERVLREDALKYIQNSIFEEKHPSLDELAAALELGTSQAEQLLENPQSLKYVKISNDKLSLTPLGQEYALRIIRAHRIYERYLAEETGFDEVEWHTLSHQREHNLSTEDVERLAHQLGNPLHDPHGKPIPTADGEIVYPSGMISLTKLPLGKRAHIVHLEDEPEAVYAQLVAEDLYVGQEIHMLESSDQRLKFWSDKGEHVLAPFLTDNIKVVQETGLTIREDVHSLPLSTLKPGQEGSVVALSPRIRGAERRRLMDLGLLPGTKVEVEMDAASGNPTAYRIRGAVIALRESQAKLINVQPNNSQ